FCPIVAGLDGRGEEAEQIRQAGIPLFDLGAYSVWHFAAAVRAVRRLLQEEKIALVNAHMAHASVVARLAAAPLRIPVVSTCHIMEQRFLPWHFWLDRLTSRWCACEICVSDCVRRFQQARTGLPESFFAVVRNGVALTRFAALPDAAALRRRLGLTENALLVGGLGRFNRQKGFDVFIRALASPALRELEFEAALAGYGPEQEALQRLADRLEVKRLRFLAPLPAEDFLPALDICALPSRWEGMSLVLLEAMACGLPIVASDIPANREVVAADGKGAARLVAPEAPEALAQALREFLLSAELRREYSRRSRALAQNFSLEKMVQGYEDIFAAALDAA
ncbi:MAG: glycosyltransferase, partial [Planctomycetota bacterium]|nr:glycosyltransferase [Planctomycetota bacterium]